MDLFRSFLLLFLSTSFGSSFIIITKNIETLRYPKTPMMSTPMFNKEMTQDLPTRYPTDQIQNQIFSAVVSKALNLFQQIGRQVQILNRPTTTPRPTTVSSGFDKNNLLNFFVQIVQQKLGLQSTTSSPSSSADEDDFNTDFNDDSSGGTVQELTGQVDFKPDEIPSKDELTLDLATDELESVDDNLSLKDDQFPLLKPSDSDERSDFGSDEILESVNESPRKEISSSISSTSTNSETLNFGEEIPIQPIDNELPNGYLPPVLPQLKNDDDEQ
ncbi:CLUMA_CG010567, isoform A [Clunio marinus]|uniref:CLUMA_CG010567, isoform A n=1 Tax=Clunio marinus TaxID=568069 RepID=A0A1J1IBQ0_9DIPT|nr:CLUMA_CG010567, isoform A [Clunio marinus]